MIFLGRGAFVWYSGGFFFVSYFSAWLRKRYSFPVSNSKVQHIPGGGGGGGGSITRRVSSACVPEAFCTINFTFLSFC